MKDIIEYVIEIHKRIVQETGGVLPVRDMSVLKQSVSLPFKKVDNEYIFSDILERAALLSFNIIKDGPFLEANKRTGIMAMIFYLSANGIKIQSTTRELIELVYKIVLEKNHYHILKYLKEHKI